MNKDDITDPKDATNYYLGSLLIGGNGAPDENGNIVPNPYNE